MALTFQQVNAPTFVIGDDKTQIIKSKPIPQDL